MPEEKDQVSATPEAPVVSESVAEPGVQDEPVDPRLANARKDAAKYRTQLRALEKKVEGIENKSKLDKMEESERLTTIAQTARAEAETYKKQAKDANVKSAAFAQASAMGFRNPQLAVGGISLSGIDVDDDGNADADSISLKLGALAKSDPYMLRGSEQPKTPIQRGQFGPSSPANENYPAAGERPYGLHNKVTTDTDALMKGQIGTDEFFKRKAEAFELNKKLDPSARGAEIQDKGG